MDVSISIIVAIYNRRDELTELLDSLLVQEDKDFETVHRLMESISYTGLGGKISAGYGKFGLSIDTPGKDIVKNFENIGNYKDIMSLSLCLPREEELENSLIEASYIVVKKSGFVASSNYAKTFRKKKDIYMIF